MSSSGTMYGNTVADGGERFYVTWSISSQSQAGNTSTIAWNAYWDYVTYSCRQLDNGNVVAGGASRWDDSGRVHDYNSGHDHRSGNLKVASGSFTVTHDSAGNYNLTISGAMTGYSGSVSSGSDTWALTRIPKVPATPSAPSATASGNTVTVTWTAPNNNGATIDSYQIQRADNSAFTTNAVTYTDTASPIAITGLNYGQLYYVRVRAHNSVGYSAWSTADTVTTGITVPGAPASAPTFSNILPISATVSYVEPSFIGGSAITGHDVQYAKDAAFTVGATTVSDAVSPADLTGLLPGTTYYVRVRAINAAGAGSWSPTGNFTTLPGAYVGNGTSWVPSLVYVGNGTSWVVAQVKSGNGTAWV